MAHVDSSSEPSFQEASSLPRTASGQTIGDPTNKHFLTGLTLGSGVPGFTGLRFSPTYTKLVVAMIKARTAFDPIIKDTPNDFTKKKYADLAAVLEATVQHLLDNELTVIQAPSFADGKITITTFLVHSSGEYLVNEFTVPVDGKVDPHAIGKAITYYRRYSIQALLNLAAEDDDGNSASGREEKPPTPRRAVNHEPAQPTNKPRPNSSIPDRQREEAKPKSEPVQSSGQSPVKGAAKNLEDAGVKPRNGENFPADSGAPKTFTEEIEAQAEASAAQRYNPQAAGEVLPTKKELDEYIAKVKAAKKGKEAFLELCGAPADTDTKKLTKAQWEIGLKKLEGK